MRLALATARRALGRTAPNPTVGAVVHRGDRVLGRGATRPPGGAHAEIVAIEAARRRFGAAALRGASMAVTLEPCCHVGRTGPCTEAILAAGIRRVAVGVRDPHPFVAGGGMARLRRAGVQVETGVLGDACREQHRGFLSVCERGRPFVVLKLAASLDGRIATAAGESRWISGSAARAEVHRLRDRSDAVMVGSGTAIADDPALSARRGGRVVHRPLRVVVDSRLRTPLAHRLLADGHAQRTVLLHGPDVPARRRAAIERTGARLVAVPRRAGGLDLTRALRALAGLGTCELLVEGGGRLAASLLRAALVDEVHWFVAPLLLGADARPALGALGIARLAHAPRLDSPRWRRLAGGDIVGVARLQPIEGSGRSR